MIWEKEKAFLKGYAHAKMEDGLPYETVLTALEYGERCHDGQTRNGLISGQPIPYFSHPIRVAMHLRALGENSHTVLSSALLHDVYEDCNVSLADMESAGIPEDVRLVVLLVSNPEVKKTDSNYENAMDSHYARMLENVNAVLVKLGDRAHNSKTMVGAYSESRMKRKVAETLKYIIPLANRAKNMYPLHANAIVILRDEIIALMELATATWASEESSK